MKQQSCDQYQCTSRHEASYIMKDNIKMDLQEVEWGGMAQDIDRWRALVYAVMNLRVP